MDSEAYKRVRQLYHELSELTAQERRRELARLELPDELRAELEALLDHDARMPAFDDGHLGAAAERLFAPGVDEGENPREEWIPEEIAGIRIDGLLGRGGMSVVYRGVQDRPRREVAVKVLHALTMGSDALRRFEYEAEILARLDHPYIAKVFQAGVDLALNDLPYIVLELVAGRDFVSHCEENRLGLQERLELFCCVCKGVEHAHQHGIVHRDLKPANILVSADGRPRILDFGIARPVTTDDASTPGRTGTGSVLGSLAWMSPEQARGELHRIDVRSDVYSLGVILYRLLTGHMPYDVDGLPVWEAARRVYEDEPKRLGHARRDLRGDLEAIASMALDKDPARRYPGAGDLGRDVRRFLDMRPVEARPWSGSYQIQKFARRHRLLVGSASLLLISIVTGLVVGIVLWRAAEAARKVADAEAERAKNEARTSQEVVDLFAGIFEQPMDFRGSGDKITVKEVLDRAAPQISSELAGEPEVRARLMLTMGEVYQWIGLLDDSEPLLQQSLDVRRNEIADDELSICMSAYKLAIVQWERGHSDLAEPLFQESIAGLKRLLGAADAKSIRAVRDYADLLIDAGRHDAAETRLREILDIAHDHLPPHDKTRLAVLSSLTVLLMTQGRFDDAEPVAIEALAGRRLALGDDHPHTIASVNSLSQIYMERGELERAEPLAVQVVEGMRSALEDKHPHTLLVTRNLANLYLRMDRPADAEPLMVRAIDGLTDVLGPNHRDTLGSRMLLAIIHERQDRFDEATDMIREVVRDATEHLSAEHPVTLHAGQVMGRIARAGGQLEKAERILLETLETSRGAMGKGANMTLDIAVDLSKLYEEEERWSDMVSVLQAAETAALDARGSEDSKTLGIGRLLAKAYMQAGQPDRGREKMLNIVDDMRRFFGPEDARTKKAVEDLESMQVP